MLLERDAAEYLMQFFIAASAEHDMTSVHLQRAEVAAQTETKIWETLLNKQTFWHDNRNICRFIVVSISGDLGDKCEQPKYE